mmetsp:Transcript_59688/g.53750  ORF Transcript_59688/g.53750 Transcript_59688/m.53750 type:complete len:146 (+) Transcript_59688:76-513(+)
MLAIRILLIISIIWTSNAGITPCIEGQKLHNTDNGAIYLCIDRKLRHIPNPTTYNNLFNAWTYTNIVTATFNLYAQDSPLVNGAVLFKGSGPAVYLTDNSGSGATKKRWITNPTAFNKYDFDWAKINTYPDSIVNAIPTGNNING